MRICLYTETALPKLGGQELVVDALARQFTAQGHDAIVLAPRPRHLRVDDSQLPYPVARHPRFISTRRLVAWYGHWLLKTNRRHRFEILHCHSVYPCGYLAALNRQYLGVPTVITSHGGDVREGNVRLAKPGLPARHSLAVARADALVAISRFTRDGFLRLYPQAEPIVAIPNGVDLAPFAQPAPRPAELEMRIQAERFVLFLGRLNRRKGVDVLLDAWAQVAPGNQEQLIVAGDGDERAALVAQAARLNLADRVHFVGTATGELKIWLLQNASFVVIPSRTWEAFPLVVLESYAAGRPVVGTRIAGLEDLVQENRTGLLTPPDSPADLATAVGRLLQNGDETRAMGRRARLAARDYGWDAVADKYLELFERLKNTSAVGRTA
jgi:glycosyltransferase involved in cell wall biosynthesis